MRVSRRNTSLLLSLLLILFTTTIIARADDDEPDEYDVTARVVRTSLIEGQVDLKRNGNQDWEHIRLNYPLVEGDTVMTGKDSRLEIQFDARNFVRLAPGSVLRIVTLRDEGVALSVVEGTVSLRLAKFDRKKEYFELDAPNTTLAAEKTGLYRIDVPREGRVRVSVRDGGSARIYSDTSGFTLRDGRSAELVISGETAGDWEFQGAAARDDVDNWVDDRERYLAQRLRYDTKYFDEYVWGAEDLDAYGDWSYTNDFGWIWQPRGVVLAGYTDWAPYRYGHWTWCPPYGWTWVGYEPWGWAPYHYGRWVFYNNYWAWVPHSKFYRHRSWWRPALVAFVFNINFGNDICWYPLSYYHRDPYARNYRHYERRPGYGGGGGGAGGGRHDRPHPPYDNPNDKTWRGVTRVPRRDFGNPDRNGRPVDDERIARRVIDIEPQRDGDLPRRGAFVGNAPHRNPEIDIPERRTGAGDRTPGAGLDDELRRSRVFRGREPRPPVDPTTSTNSTQTNTPATPTETRPTGVVARPETPRDDSPGRVVRPVNPDGVEKRERNRVGIETPQPRVDPPRSEPPRSEPPRSEPPRSEPPRSEPPRSEPPRSEPRREEPRREEPRREEPRREEPRREEPRREEPRSQPKSETPREPVSAPRETPKASPRFEAPPRSEPRSEPKSEPRSEPSRPSSPPPRNDPPAKSESPRSEPRSEPRDSPKKPDNE